MAIAIQQKKEHEAYDEKMALPLTERVAKGICINNVKVVFNFYEGLPNQWCRNLTFPHKYIRFAKILCNNNISKFREGEQVTLSNGVYSFKMVVLEDSLTDFILKPNDFDVSDCYIDTSNYSENNWEINIVKTNLTLKLLTATANNLQNDSRRLLKIEQLLNGGVSNKYSSSENYKGLNYSQNKAVNSSVSTSDFHLIQGPPGTGKTETIAHITRLLLDQGKKVFITAPTHTAINNCLNAVSKRVKDNSKLVKIGENYQAEEILDNEYITRKTRLPLDRFNNDSSLSKSGIVIGGTPYCFCYPASKRLNFWEFDVAIIDEAAQLSIPLAVSVMSKSDKYIFVGDHQQLDPIIPTGTGLSMFAESIFRKLVNLYPSDVTLLDISYRLNPSLIRIPNDLFYENKLKSSIDDEASPRNFISKGYSEILNHPDHKVLYLHSEFDSQGRSPYEANIVAELINDLLSNGVQKNEIGILTPYRAQVREIKKAINQKVPSIDFKEGETLFVDTVDRMQGQERDYILYSMSNSHPLESKRRLDFFYSPNRLNVAITRAIKKCIVIANYKVFDIIDEELVELPEFKSIKPSLDTFKEYYRLTSKVKAELEDDGY